VSTCVAGSNVLVHDELEVHAGRVMPREVAHRGVGPGRKVRGHRPRLARVDVPDLGTVWTADVVRLTHRGRLVAHRPGGVAGHDDELVVHRP